MQGLVITNNTEGSPIPTVALQHQQQPSIVTGIGRKSSLEIDHHHQQLLLHQQHQQQQHSGSAPPLPPNYLQLHHQSATSHQQSWCNMEQRRDSDKSLAFSDDSLSNDSAPLSSPGQDGVPSTASSSGFKSGRNSAAHSDATCCDAAADPSGRLSPDSLSGSSTTATLRTPTDAGIHNMVEECYELPLPITCYNLDAHRILTMVKETIDSKMPPMGFVLHPGTSTASPTATESQCAAQSSSATTTTEQHAASSSASTMPAASMIDCTSNLSLEYSGGLQIELQVCGGRRPSETSADGSSPSAPTGNMGLKMRRISGDQFEYGKLCQQLISSLTV